MMRHQTKTQFKRKATHFFQALRALRQKLRGKSCSKSAAIEKFRLPQDSGPGGESTPTGCALEGGVVDQGLTQASNLDHRDRQKVEFPLARHFSHHTHMITSPGPQLINWPGFERLILSYKQALLKRCPPDSFTHPWRPGRICCTHLLALTYGQASPFLQPWNFLINFLSRRKDSNIHWRESFWILKASGDRNGIWSIRQTFLRTFLPWTPFPQAFPRLPGFIPSNSLPFLSHNFTCFWGSVILHFTLWVPDRINRHQGQTVQNARLWLKQDWVLLIQSHPWRR